MLSILALLLALLALATAFPIYRHALGRSVGTLALVLGVPLYLLVYAFSHFEHPHKHWLVPTLLGSMVLSATLVALA